MSSVGVKGSVAAVVEEKSSGSARSATAGPGLRGGSLAPDGAEGSRTAGTGRGNTRRAVGLGLVFALVVGGGLALRGATFTTGMVHDQLAAQKITFPPRGAPALDPAKFPGLQRYAGQTVDDGPKAKAFADQYIATHLQSVAEGRTYAEVSGAARVNPGDQKLAGQKQALFEGEALRGMLLSAWGWSVVGSITGLVAYGAFAAAAMVLALLVLGSARRSGGGRGRAPAEASA